MTINELFLNLGGSVKYQIECYDKLIVLDNGVIDDYDFKSNPLRNKTIAHISIDNNTVIVLVD